MALSGHLGGAFAALDEAGERTLERVRRMGLGLPARL
jgi:hypothetical protein